MAAAAHEFGDTGDIAFDAAEGAFDFIVGEFA